MQKFVIGGVQLEKNRIGGQLPGADAAAHAVSGLWGRVDGQVHDVPLQMIAWYISVHLLVLTTSKSDITPSACV